MHFPAGVGRPAFLTSDESKNGPSFVIESDSGNQTFVRIQDPHKKVDNRVAVALFNMRIVNNLGANATLKEVVLSYENKGKYAEVLGSVIPPGDTKFGTKAMLLVSKNGVVFIDKWNDIRVVISEDKERSNGAIWRGSAVFILNADVEKFDDVKNIRLIARDYINHESSVHISPSQSDAIIRYQKFTQGSDGEITWGN